MRDAKVADAAVLLPAPQRPQMRLPVEQVMHLHKVYALAPEQCKRALHLRDACLAPARPDLGGDEGALGIRRGRQQVAQHSLGAAIHRRAVEHLAAGVTQRADHGSQRLELLGVGADIESHVGTAADDRQCFAARWNGTCLHRVSSIAGLRNGELMTEECGAHAGSKPQESRT